MLTLFKAGITHRAAFTEYFVCLLFTQFVVSLDKSIAIRVRGHRSTNRLFTLHGPIYNANVAFSRRRACLPVLAHCTVH